MYLRGARCIYGYTSFSWELYHCPVEGTETVDLSVVLAYRIILQQYPPGPQRVNPKHIFKGVQWQRGYCLLCSTIGTGLDWASLGMTQKSSDHMDRTPSTQLGSEGVG